VLSADPLLESLQAAVEAAPDDVVLRIHLAELLLAADDREAALRQLGKALDVDPGSSKALELIAGLRRADAQPDSTGAEADELFANLEAEMGDLAPPMFVEGAASGDELADAWETDPGTVTLADVGGLTDVKERLELAFLAPMRNPELRKMYGKNMRGGLLLYGPPGCGKGFIARALAGELGASFVEVSINDVLDMYIGSSERNLHSVFVTARKKAPTVLFFDELDALGRKRSHLSRDAMRTTVNQLLHELDGGDSNDDIFVLGATNHPWDVDSALTRPGRFDRTVLVLPPDLPAREAIFRTHLQQRPVAGIDLGRLATLTDGFSGADIAHVCETATEKAMIDAVKTGDLRMIEMRDLEAALREVRPSTGSWFDLARNVVTFANTDGTYDDLRAYMKRRGLA
jgi:SpoVK/Ycf46/Vps4 family AAA+-type ATPase